jgi:6-pyruvoyltetrahydropterin/6-carboxytetrahydropterin synthase
MYKVKKRIEVAGSHCLALDYESKCKNMHGHNWIIEVEISGEVLNTMGMLVDFTHIKEVVMKLDHAYINDVVIVNPTAENICKWIHTELQYAIAKAWAISEGVQPTDVEEVGSYFPKVSKVTVQESEGNIACYTP